MEHKITFKTKDGVIKEQTFDDFNEFADKIEDVAVDYYAGMIEDGSRFDVETMYDTMIRQERVTNYGAASSDRGIEHLREEAWSDWE